MKAARRIYRIGPHLVVVGEDCSIVDFSNGGDRMAKEDDLDMLEAMERIGGDFVKALAKAAGRADVHNYRKLEEAFPEIWKDYREKAAMMRARKEKS